MSWAPPSSQSSGILSGSATIPQEEGRPGHSVTPKPYLRQRRSSSLRQSNAGEQLWLLATELVRPQTLPIHLSSLNLQGLAKLRDLHSCGFFLLPTPGFSKSRVLSLPSQSPGNKNCARGSPLHRNPGAPTRHPPTFAPRLPTPRCLPTTSSTGRYPRPGFPALAQGTLQRPGEGSASGGVRVTQGGVLGSPDCVGARAAVTSTRKKKKSFPPERNEFPKFSQWENESREEVLREVTPRLGHPCKKIKK